MLVEPLHTSTGLRFLPFSQTMNLLCAMFVGFASRSFTRPFGSLAALSIAMLSSRGKGGFPAGAVLLRVDDQLDVDAAVDRLLEPVGDGLVAELVEAAQQPVALP